MPLFIWFLLFFHSFLFSLRTDYSRFWVPFTEEGRTSWSSRWHLKRKISSSHLAFLLPHYSLSLWCRRPTVLGLCFISVIFMFFFFSFYYYFLRFFPQVILCPSSVHFSCSLFTTRFLLIVYNIYIYKFFLSSHMYMVGCPYNLFRNNFWLSKLFDSDILITTLKKKNENLIGELPDAKNFVDVFTPTSGKLLLLRDQNTDTVDINFFAPGISVQRRCPLYVGFIGSKILRHFNNDNILGWLGFPTIFFFL